jgi:hypothetical protein
LPLWAGLALTAFVIHPEGASQVHYKMADPDPQPPVRGMRASLMRSAN